MFPSSHRNSLCSGRRRFPPLDHETEQEPSYFDVRQFDPGSSDPICPLLARERAHHRDLAVVGDHWMQPGKAAGGAYDFIQKPMSLEIVNQPSLVRCTLKQNEKVAKLFIAEMVRDKAAHDDVKPPPRRQIKDIHHREIDLIRWIRHVPGNPDRFGVQVNAKKSRLQIPFV